MATTELFRHSVIIIIIAEMAVFNVAGYLIEQRCRCPTGTIFQINSGEGWVGGEVGRGWGVGTDGSAHGQNGICCVNSQLDY